MADATPAPASPYRRRSTRTPLAERFWPKVDKDGPDGCWVWTGSRAEGYGRITSGGDHGRCLRAHHVAYELLVGPIEPGLHLDHLCRNRACVNPDHLEPVTARENCWERSRWANGLSRMTHCRHGHEFTPENTYLHGEKRHCRECRRVSKANWNARERDCG